MPASAPTSSSCTAARRSSRCRSATPSCSRPPWAFPSPPPTTSRTSTAGSYCTCYLRAWAFESQLAAWLRDRWGGSWFRRREAGMLLREVWELGQSLDADQLLREITGERIEFSVLAAEARAALA